MSTDAKLRKRTNGDAKSGDEVVPYKPITTTAEGRKVDELLDQHGSYGFLHLHNALAYYTDAHIGGSLVVHGVSLL